MSNRLESHLREERAARNLTQREMAELAGISRQSYVAIESARSVPSTEVALRLARGLGVPVESLFHLPADGPARLSVEVGGERPGGRGPVRVVKVGGRRIGIPAGPVGSRELRIADGIGTVDRQGRMQVELFDARPPSCDLVAVGCDPAFQLVSDALRQRAGVEALAISRGSRAALETLARGEAHVAGIHIVDPESGEYNAAWVRRLVPFSCERVRFSSWEQCLLVRPDAGGGIGGLGDLASGSVRFLNRESGSGTRMLLDRALSAEGIPASEIPGYERTVAAGHLAVAEGVASGLADVGVGIRAAGSAYGLRTIPVAREWYDLVIPRHFVDLPAVQALLDVLRTPSLRDQVNALGGYDVEGMGESMGVCEPEAGGAA